MLMDIECNTSKEVEKIKKEKQPKQKKIKNKDRLIAKMVATALISAGVIAGATGIVLAKSGVNEMPKNYVDNGKYIAGAIASTIGVTTASIGVSVYPFKKEETQENQNTL